MPCACPPTSKQMCRGQRPPSPCPPRPVPGRPQKTARPRTPGDTPLIILSPDPMGPRTQIRLGARTHEPVTIIAVRG
jgi:hypothetical protein